MEYEKGRIELAVRNMLAAAKDQGGASTAFLALLETLPGGVSWSHGAVRFLENGSRTAHVTLTDSDNDLHPMQISVLVTASDVANPKTGPEG